MRWLALSLLLGCGSAGSDALKMIAPIAAETLRAVAAERGVEIDEEGGMCVPLPEDYGDVPGVLVMCWAPDNG